MRHPATAKPHPLGVTGATHRQSGQPAFSSCLDVARSADAMEDRAAQVRLARVACSGGGGRLVSSALAKRAWRASVAGKRRGGPAFLQFSLAANDWRAKEHPTARSRFWH